MTDTHIKINAVTPRVQYTGNGSTTVFPYEFAIFDESDMVVYLGDEVQESGYSVSGAGQTEGGNVTFDVAPEDGVKITLLRSIPIERITDFQEGGTFRPKNLNDEFDRQTAFLQQVQETLDRSVKVGPTSDIDPEEVLGAIERVYDDIDNIDIVASNITDISTVAGISSDVTIVSGNKTNIDAVAENKTNIDAVAGNATNINAVNANKTNIDTVSTNISDVNTVADNIDDIKDKANKNMDNVTTTGKETVVNWAMPDYSAGVSLSNSTTYTADKPCLVVQKVSGNTATTLTINDVEFQNNTNGGTTTAGWFVHTGDEYKTSASGTFVKYPLKGA